MNRSRYHTNNPCPTRKPWVSGRKRRRQDVAHAAELKRMALNIAPIHVIKKVALSYAQPSLLQTTFPSVMGADVLGDSQRLSRDPSKACG